MTIIERVEIEPTLINTEKTLLSYKILEGFDDQGNPIYQKDCNGDIEYRTLSYPKKLEKNLVSAVKIGEWLTIIFEDKKIVNVS